MLRHDQLPPIPAVPRSLPDGPLYFVGVGGAGMSAIALVLAEKGRTVAGGDPGISDAVRARLERAGVQVYQGHDAAQLGAAAVVVVSDAVPENNPEVRAARERGIPIFRRPEVLGAIVNAGRGIAIAGTHGKTTTTGMVASILLAAGLDPTILLGGDLPAIRGNARTGAGEWVVAEACEAYDGFLYLHPEIAVVLNIESDHLDYHGDEAHVFASFARFMRQTAEYGRKLGSIAPLSATPGNAAQGGLIVALGGDAKVDGVIDQAFPDRSEADAPVQTYAIGDDLCTVSARNVTPQGTGSAYTLMLDAGEGAIERGEVTLAVPGRHNVLNSLAAVAVGLNIGVSIDDIVVGLRSFTGTGRRFERLGEVHDVLIVDDYAHHPTELRATLAAARSAYPERRIVAVFQPHLPSRTRDLMVEFADALTAADAVYLTDIYLAREQPLPGISSAVLAERTRAAAPSRIVELVPDKTDLPARLLAGVRAGDLVLTLGAGDIRAAGEALLKELNR